MKKIIKKPRYSIIIPVFNEGDWLKFTIDGVLHDDSFEDYEIVVVDDSSTDGCANFLQLEFYLDLIKSGKINLVKNVKIGLSNAKNYGSFNSTGEILIFIDGHMEIVDGWLEKIDERLKKYPAVKILSLTIYDIKGEKSGAKNGYHIYSSSDISLRTGSWVFIPEESDNLEIVKVPFVPGGACVVYKDVFDKTGGFPEFLEGWGVEDLAFSLIAYYHGFDLYNAPDILIGHRFSKSSELGNEVNKRKNFVLYNSIAATYVLYDSAHYTQVINLISTLSGFEIMMDKFSEKKEEIDGYKNNLQKNRQREYKDFLREFGEKLPYLYLADFENGKSISDTNPEEAIKLFDKSIKTKYPPDSYSTTGDFISAVKIEIAKTYLKNGQHKKALDAIYSIQFKNGTWKDSCDLGILYYNLESYFFAEAFFLQSIALLREDTKTDVIYRSDMLAYIFDYLSLCYYQTNKIEKSVKYVNKAIKISHEKKRNRLIENRKFFLQFKNRQKHSVDKLNLVDIMK